MKRNIILKDWENKYKAIGYRIKIYEALYELFKYLSTEEFLLYKGSALELTVYNKEGYLRTFGDIDLVILEENVYKRLKQTELYDTKQKKFIKYKNVMDVDVKLVFDIKYDKYIEERILKKDIFRRSQSLEFQRMRVRVPSLEDNILLALAHDIKHRNINDIRHNFSNDLEILLKQNYNKELLIESAKKYNLEEEIFGVLK